MEKKTFAFGFMDPPFESARTATFFRILSATIKKGYGIRVFAYEGAVGLSSSLQEAHGNVLHSRSASIEAHPLPGIWINYLRAAAQMQGVQFEWVNCDLCADERGLRDTVGAVVRGTPADFVSMLFETENALTIGTR